MKLIAALPCVLLSLASADPRSTSMVITRTGTKPTVKGAPANFTGAVEVTQLFSASEPLRASAGTVTFEPGARSRWHTHPSGQMLVVLSGSGWVQAWGEAKQEVHAGDVIWTPAGVKHWHGATSTSALTHIAIQEPVGGKAVDWLEPVTDAQYRK